MTTILTKAETFFSYLCVDSIKLIGLEKLTAEKQLTRNNSIISRLILYEWMLLLGTMYHTHSL